MTFPTLAILTICYSHFIIFEKQKKKKKKKKKKKCEKNYERE